MLKNMATMTLLTPHLTPLQFVRKLHALITIGLKAQFDEMAAIHFETIYQE